MTEQETRICFLELQCKKFNITASWEAPGVSSVHELAGCARQADSGPDDALILEYFMLVYAFCTWHIIHGNAQQRKRHQFLWMVFIISTQTWTSECNSIHSACCAMFIVSAQCHIDSLIAASDMLCIL